VPISAFFDGADHKAGDRAVPSPTERASEI
jgi:hypothetical protein